VITDRQREYLRHKEYLSLEDGYNKEAQKRRKRKLFWRRFWNLYLFGSSIFGTGVILALLVALSQNLL
jgi:hypothetical protein